MIKLIKHTYNLLRSKTRDIGLPIKRSSKWAKVEKEFLYQHPACAVCNSTERLNVHHAKPFHIFPELELDENNLITLCMSEKECHFRLGHGSNYRSYCSDIYLYIDQFHNKEKTFEELCVIAKANRLN